MVCRVSVLFSCSNYVEKKRSSLFVTKLISVYYELCCKVAVYLLVCRLKCAVIFVLDVFTVRDFLHKDYVPFMCSLVMF